MEPSDRIALCPSTINGTQVMLYIVYYMKINVVQGLYWHIIEENLIFLKQL